jgi:hypothetical protein
VLHLFDGAHYRQPLQIVLRQRHCCRLRAAGLKASGGDIDCQCRACRAKAEVASRELRWSE